MPMRRPAGASRASRASAGSAASRPSSCQNILKGGEDSVGVNEAIQRVYFNIGSCAEQCWINHIPDLRAVDPTQRNYGQTPFDIGQCRRDCASFRAIEDRLTDVEAFFLSARPTDLWRARGHTDPRDLEIAPRSGVRSTAPSQEGHDVFARTCARCHSSQNGPYENVDFHAVDPHDAYASDRLAEQRRAGVRERDRHLRRRARCTPITCRAGSGSSMPRSTSHERPADPNRREVMKGGGRGYYRNLSLLTCLGARAVPAQQRDRAGGLRQAIRCQRSISTARPTSTPTTSRSQSPPACWPYDPSVEGRYKLYKASMEMLLNPGQRIPKLFTLDQDVIVDVAPKLKIGDLETGLSLRVPKGSPAVMLNSLRYKDLLQDVVLAARDPAKLDRKYETLLTPEQLAELQGRSRPDPAASCSSKQGFMTFDITAVQRDFIQRYYSNVLERVENAGHRFGENLSDREKQALIAFLATL